MLLFYSLLRSSPFKSKNYLRLIGNYRKITMDTASLQPDTLCMIPGPIEFEPEVLKAFSVKGVSHVDPKTREVFGQCLEMLKEVFLAPDGQPIIVTGSGTLGWEMVAANLIEDGDQALVINTGYFGDSFADCLEVFGAKVVSLKAEVVGACPTINELEAVLRSQKFKLITVTHVDTSTGVLTDVESIAKTVRKIQPDALLIVDGVCASGGEECRATEWDIDFVMTGSQKCIGVPSGLSISLIRPRALKVIETPKPKKSYYADLNRWIPIMKNYAERKPCYFATPAVNHLFALRIGLNILLANGGMEARFQEHRLMSKGIKAAIHAMGLNEVPQGCSANTLTCVYYPPGVEEAELLKKVREAGVTLAGGLHKSIKTKYFRIGHMGPSSRRLDHALTVIEALEKSLTELGHKFEKGVGVAKLKSVVGHLPMGAN